MTKVDIVENIYEKVGFSKKEVAKIVEYIFDIIKDTLIKEDKIKISGFGNFVVRKKRSKTGPKPTNRERHRDHSKKDLDF
jgi:integration host factor subunit alpha